MTAWEGVDSGMIPQSNEGVLGNPRKYTVPQSLLHAPLHAALGTINSSHNSTMTDNITAVFGTHEEKTLAQLRDVGSRAEQVALMADGHVGYVMPIGGVAAYDNKASVVG